MARLVGILVGSALAVAFLIVAFGVPEFAPAPQPEPADAQHAAIDTPIAPAETSPAAPIEPESPTPARIEPERPEAETETTAAVRDGPAAEPAPDPVPVLPASEPVSEPVSEPAPDPAALEQNWYAFWSPFRSRIAAEGFIAELQRTTGLDYRVVRLKPGVYEVAFAYTSDNDIADKLTQISAATGLDMSGG